VQGFINVTGYTFPVLRLGQSIQSLYGIFYDNYVVIDADGIIRYTSVNETYTGLGRFHDGNLRAALTGEVTAAGDPKFETSLHITSPVRAGDVATLRLGLPAAAGTRLELFDARGRRLHEIPAPPAAGWQVLPWRTTGRGNAPLGTGVYFVQMRSKGERTTAKFVVVPR